MIGERVALLVGLFVVPALLLALGHRLRRREPVWRRIFWGAITAHFLALLVTMTASLYPPIWWAGGSFWRDAAVHWSLLFGALLGAGIGAVWPALRRRLKE